MLSTLKSTAIRLAAMTTLSRRFCEKVAEHSFYSLKGNQSRTSTLLTHLFKQSDPDNWFRCDLNGFTVELPTDTVRTMTHCIFVESQGPLRIRIEQAHLNWMISKMGRGGVFLDVGAATGAVSIPIAKTFGSSVDLYCLEPARTARRLLEMTCKRNSVQATILPYAVSNQPGMGSFAEFPHDESGTGPFALTPAS